MKTESKITDILRVEGIMSQGFGISPKIVMRDQRLTVEAKAIYCYIAAFAGGGTRSFPGRDMMIEELGMSLKRYYKHMQLLIDCDYLRIEQEKSENGLFGRNIYTIVANPESDYLPEGTHRAKRDNSGEIARNERSNMNREKAARERLPEEAHRKPQERVFDEADRKPQEKKTRRREQVQRESNTDSLRLQLGIDELIAANPADKSEYELILNAAKDMVQSKEIKVAGAVKDHEAIMQIISQLNADHVRVVLKTLNDNRGKIKSMRTYTQACLINSIYEDVGNIVKEIEEKAEARNKEEQKAKAAQEAENAKNEKKRLLESYPELKKLDDEAKDLSMQICRAVFNGSKNERTMLEKRRNEIDLRIEEFCEIHGIDRSMTP